MLSANPGWVTTQGEILAGLLAQAGYPVRQTSHIPARLPRLADTLRSLVAWRHEIDLVIHQVFSGPAFFIADAASALCRFFGLPQVFVLHGGALPEFATNRSGWVRRVIHRADAIIAPSGYLAGIFEDICSPGQRIDIIPNILSIEDYPWRFRPSVQPRLFWMRTFHPIYNPQMAIDVLAEVRHTHPKAVLTMAGQDKGQLAAVVAEAERKRLSDAVSFPGFLSTSAKNNEFNSHDIFLNTNRVDNMPVSVLEAMAYGLPVVATNVGGLPYLLDDGQTGLLVPDDDVAAMVGAVRRLLAEPGLAARLSTNGRQLAESCGWAAVRIRWEALFKEVLHA
jgi:glycosyltransferase involved in cell wall biosynthesis